MAIDSSTLENLWKVYYYVGLFATVLFVLKLILFSVMGGDSEVSADFNTETDTDFSFDFLSFQSILAFLMGFGWMGYAALQQFGFKHLMSFMLAFATGFVFMFITAFLMFSVKKLEKNVRKDKTTALNTIGKAYTNFNPHGQGQIEIVINGQLTVSPAVNLSDKSINSFDPVKVVKVQNDMLYIEKVR